MFTTAVRTSILSLLLMGASLPYSSFSLAEDSKNPCAFLLEDPEFSAQSLKNSFLIIPSRPVFTDWERWWFRFKLDAYQRRHDRKSLKYEGFRSFRGISFNPKGTYDPHDYNEQKIRAFLGDSAFKRLHQFALEVKDILRERFPGDLYNFSVGIRGSDLPDLFEKIRVRTGPNGEIQGGHRHLGPLREFYSYTAPDYTDSYVDVSVLKTEVGQATVVRDAAGNLVSAQNGEVTVFTDAWHAMPPSKHNRLIILISATICGPEYENYYCKGEYPDANYR